MPYDFGDSGLLDAVKNFEGYTPQAQWDYKQYSSGYGTRARPGETIDQATADERLRNELNQAANFVDRNAPDLPPGVRDAMISLTFNTGGKWANSNLGDQLRAGDYQNAKQTLQQYNRADGQVLPGLVNRRAQEASWFDMQGAPTGVQAAALQTGNQRMPDTSRGMVGMLDPTAPREDTRPQGLLGALSDPESIAYMSMIAKAFNPWSQMNPEQLLIQAQKTRESQAQRAMDRWMKDREFNLKESEYLARQQQAQAEREASARLYRGMGGQQPAQPLVQPQPQDQGNEAAPLGLGPPPAPVAQPLTTDESRLGPEVDPQTGLNRQAILRGLMDPNLPKETKIFLQSRLGALEERGKISRDVAERQAIATKPVEQGGFGLQPGSREYQEYATTGKITPQEKPMSPMAATQLARAESFLGKASDIRKAIANDELTGPVDVTLAQQGFGSKGQIYRDIQSGIEALRSRGVSVDESRYLPTYKDTTRSMLAKHDALVEELDKVRTGILRGRGPSEEPRSTSERPSAGALTTGRQRPPLSSFER